MTVKCAIVTPTLEYEAGLRAVTDAARTAGKGIIALTHVTLDVWESGGCKPASIALDWALGTGAPYICYINDDVWFPQEGWLLRLIRALESDEKAMVAGPSGKCGTRPQMTGKMGMPEGIIPVRQLSYFCACFKRDIFGKIGRLDTAYRHWGCDSDYNERIRQAGFKCLWVQHAWVDHRTVPHNRRNPKVVAWKQHDVKLFRERWR